MKGSTAFRRVALKRLTAGSDAVSRKLEAVSHQPGLPACQVLPRVCRYPDGMHLPKSISGKLRIFVRRGALRRFHRLTRDAKDLPVEVTWDRRQEERRETPDEVMPDRRNTDRRKDPSFTWDMADFVVVESDKEPK